MNSKMSTSISNFHTHTTFCDGKNTPEEYVLAAINANCKEIGFSGHSYTFFDQRYCMSKTGTQTYKDDIHRLQDKYSNRIHIYCGIEQDYYSTESTDDYDYVIGAVHYVNVAGNYYSVDGSAEQQMSCVKECYNGDYDRFAEDYYRAVADLYNKTHCNIIAHFDLITKFNEKNHLFDTKSTRYTDSANNALQQLLLAPSLFEINTGAIARGYTTKPYPNDEILSQIGTMGRKFVLSSDAHSAEKLLFGIEEEHLRMATLGYECCHSLSDILSHSCN